MEINKADYELLLRVPGIGVKSARRIVTARRNGSISYYDLEKFGVVLKRARFSSPARVSIMAVSPSGRICIRSRLIPGKDKEQLSLFSPKSEDWSNVDNSLVNSGEDFGGNQGRSLISSQKDLFIK